MELPEEIVTDILSRLPVKILLRFMCVSKPYMVIGVFLTIAQTHHT